MGGRGSPSRIALPRGKDVSDWREAFDPGVDYERSGDVDHDLRIVSDELQKRWDRFTEDHADLTRQDNHAIMKDWDWHTREVFGYVRTTNSFKINEQLYDPNNAGKTDAEIFTRTDRQGNLRDLETVRTLDRLISRHTTGHNAYYTRFCSPGAVKATYGLTDEQMSALSRVTRGMSRRALDAVNRAFRGTVAYSEAFTSTSANRSMNAFNNPNASQSKGFVFERRIYAPEGTKAFMVQRNAQESEVIFGRRMQTRIMKVEVSGDGHIVIHEMFDGYRRAN